MTACTDTSTLPSAVEAQYAKGGGGPKVTGADPDAAPQGVTIDVEVTGSGFEEGSAVQFLLDGKNTPKIVTNITTFNDSDNSLTANITIAVDADVALYDIKVTSSRGRKGIGTELFGVKQGGGGPPPGEIQHVSLVVEVLRDGTVRGMTDVPEVNAAIALATTDDEFLCHLGTVLEACDPTEREAFFGCPDINRSCGRILFTFSGGSDADNIRFRVSHSVQGCVDGEIVVGGCVYDSDLTDAWKASGRSQVSQPDLLISEVSGTPALTENGDGTRTLTVYWQGQRGQKRVWSDEEHVWSRYPKLDPVGSMDFFVFRARSGNTFFQACVSPTLCWAEYTGDAGTQAYVVWDGIQPLGRFRGKKPQTTGIKFEFQAFSDPQPLDGLIDYGDPDVVASNLQSSARVMLVDASGKQMLPVQSIGSDPDDPDKPGIYKSGYQFTFPASGCYEFRLLEVFIHDVDDLEYVWYSQGDVAAIKTLRVDHVDGGETTWIPGGTCNFS